MKKISLILFFFLLSMHIYSQAGASVVYDPVNNAELVKSTIFQSENVANTSAMVASLNTAIDYMNKTEEALKVVNAGLEAILWTKRVYQRQVDIIRMQYELTVKADKLKRLSPEELKRFNDQLLSVVECAEAMLTSAKDILTSGKYKMNDSERLNQLKELDRYLSFQQTVMKIQYFEIRTISEERELIKTYKMLK